MIELSAHSPFVSFFRIVNVQDLGLEKPSWLPDFGGKKDEDEPKAETDVDTAEEEKKEPEPAAAKEE